jgi:hypothetical protein
MESGQTTTDMIRETTQDSSLAIDNLQETASSITTSTTKQIEKRKQSTQLSAFASSLISAASQSPGNSDKLDLNLYFDDKPKTVTETSAKELKDIYLNKQNIADSIRQKFVYDEIIYELGSSGML